MEAIRRLAHAVQLAYGWRRPAIAFVAGLATTLTLPPVDAFPVFALTLPLLVWLIDGAGAGRLGGVISSFVVGWWFGFGYFLASLYWVGMAFLVEAEQFAWALPFAVTLLPAGLALFIASGFALARLFWRPGAQRVIVLAVALTLAELARATLFTGFPWNTFGYGLTGVLAFAQGAALVGVHGLGLLALAVFATPALLADDPAETAHPFRAVVLALVALGALGGYGAARLSLNPTTYTEAVRLRIMQPNLAQADRFTEQTRRTLLERYARLSEQPGPSGKGLAGVTHLIWPESAFPFLLTREPGALVRIGDLLPRGTLLVTGAARAEEPSAAGGPTRYFNAIYLIGDDGAPLALYDKVHLVPFGEYLPLRPLFEAVGLRALARERVGFEAGTRRRPMGPAGGVTFLPLICYEVIFPAGGEGERPGFIVNVTDDSWFGRTAGPYQHLRQAQIRAIENGIPLVRAANTGISTLVDPLGRPLFRLPLGTEGVIDSPLPMRVDEPLASRYSYINSLLVALLLGIGVTFFRRKRR